MISGLVLKYLKGEGLVISAGYRPEWAASTEVPLTPPRGGFLGYPAWITTRATDALRGDVTLKGGITGVVKSNHLAEAFNMKYELHHDGNSLNNIANAHVALATTNCDWFEVILPDTVQKYAVINELELDTQGHIRPPGGPGLGAEIDFDLIERMKVAVLRQEPATKGQNTPGARLPRSSARVH